MNFSTENKSIEISARKNDRRGAVLVLCGTVLTVLMAMVAFGVDVGYMHNARTQLQNSADSAAMAACWELVQPVPLGGISNSMTNVNNARNIAVNYAGLNKVCTTSPNLDLNTPNAVAGEIVIGYMANPSDPAETMNLSVPPSDFNAVKVTLYRSASRNGEVSLFFARLLGINSISMKATGTAAVLRSVQGFHLPSDSSILPIIPFALSQETWNDYLAGSGSDNYKWNPATNSVTNGSDGVHEISMFPSSTNSPGNFGTVDVGSPNNSTSDVVRQITQGLNSHDLSFLGGEFSLNDSGTMQLDGDTGVSSGFKSALESIVGQKRIIPLYSTVTGSGDTADYTIVSFISVRIMHVHLTGNNKYIAVEPASMIVKGIIPPATGSGIGGSAGSGSNTSYSIYSPVYLVR